MAKRKKIKIEGFDEITVFEISNQTAMDFVKRIQADMDKGFSELITDNLDKLIKICCDADRSIFIKMTPSETKEVIDGFLEVNETLFTFFATIGIDKIFKGLQNIIIPEIIKNFSSVYTGTTENKE